MSKVARTTPLLVLFAMSPLAAASDGVRVTYPSAVGATAPLRDLPAPEAPTPAGEAREINPLGRFERPPLPDGAAVAADPVLQDGFGPEAVDAMPATFLNFAGQGNAQGYLPPDTTGAIGPNHYVQAVNVRFAIYSRTGTLVAGFPKDISVLWAGLPAGSVCKSHNDGDPIVLYDRLADRWLVSQFAVLDQTFDNAQCLAVSQTGDPTGAWYVYQFDWGSKMNDYPHFGIWPDGYYMTVALLPVLDPLALRISSFVPARVVRGSSPISGWNLAAQTSMGPDLVVLLPPRVEDPTGVLEA